MKCSGCGIELQSQDPEKIGYVPEKALVEREDPLCQRCYKIKHYGRNIMPEVMHFDTSRLKEVANECSATFIVADILDVTGTWSPELRKSAGSHFFVILNKFDLIPKHISADQIIQWFSSLYNVSPEQVKPLSCKNGFGVQNLIKFISSLDKVCLAGATNVGKSTIVNKIIDSDSLTHVTSSQFSGTTLDRVTRTLDSGTVVIDTPGLELPGRLIQVLDVYKRHMIFKTDRLSRKTFKPDPGRSVFFGGLCRIDVLDHAREGLRPIFQLFSGHNIAYHETKTTRADDLLKRKLGTLLKPPFSERRVEDYNWKTEEIVAHDGEDIGIGGLGWINIKRGPLKVKISVPDNTTVEKRNAIFTKDR